MKTFRIYKTEVELWDRTYIVEAETEKEAIIEFNKGNWECEDGNCQNEMSRIDDIQEVEK